MSLRPAYSHLDEKRRHPDRYAVNDEKANRKLVEWTLQLSLYSSLSLYSHFSSSFCILCNHYIVIITLWFMEVHDRHENTLRHDQSDAIKELIPKGDSFSHSLMITSPSLSPIPLLCVAPWIEFPRFSHCSWDTLCNFFLFPSWWSWFFLLYVSSLSTVLLTSHILCYPNIFGCCETHTRWQLIIRERAPRWPQD